MPAIDLARTRRVRLLVASILLVFAVAASLAEADGAMEREDRSRDPEGGVDTSYLDYAIIDSYSGQFKSGRYCVSGGIKRSDSSICNPALDRFDANYYFSGVKGGDGTRLIHWTTSGDLLTVYEQPGHPKVAVYVNPQPQTANTGVERSSWARHVKKLDGQSEEAAAFNLDGSGADEILVVLGNKGTFGHYARTATGSVGEFTKWKGKGFEIPSASWMRIGGADKNAAGAHVPIDLDDNDCPEILLGSKSGKVGALKCPPGDRGNPEAWRYVMLATGLGEVQRLTAKGNRVVVSVKSGGGSGRGVGYIDVDAEAFASGEIEALDFRKKPVRRDHFVSTDQKAMELEIADVDGDELMDLVIPTRKNSGEGGQIMVWFGIEDANDPFAGLEPWTDEESMVLQGLWKEAWCRSHNHMAFKGVAVGDLWIHGSRRTNAIVVNGRGCAAAANGIWYTADDLVSGSGRRDPGNWSFRSLTDPGTGFWDDVEMKFDRPILYDFNKDYVLDVASSDEDGTWKKTFGSADGKHPGVGTIVWYGRRFGD